MTGVIDRRFYIQIKLTAYLLIFGSLHLAVTGNKNELAKNARLQGLGVIEPVPALFNKSYSGSVTDSRNVIYRFNFSRTDVKMSAVRIFTTGSESEKEYPTVVVVRQERSVMSWQIPLLMHDSGQTYDYKDVSRTLCPVDTNRTEQKIYLEISTQAKTNVSYTLRAILLEDFIIETGKDHKVTSSPSSPVYSKYTFPDGVQSVRVTAKSSDSTCAVLSIQSIDCPVFDLDTDIEYQGRYQTMTKQGVITIKKSAYPIGSFFVVLVVKPNDNECTDGFKHKSKLLTQTVVKRQKSVTVNIAETLSTTQFYTATLSVTGFFLSFYLVALCFCICTHCCKQKCCTIGYTKIKDKEILKTEKSKKNAAVNGDIQEDRTQVEEPSQNIAKNEGVAQNYGSTSISKSATDESHSNTVTQDMKIRRRKVDLKVKDLAMKREKKVNKTYMLYLISLFTIAIFYGLPVIQLVMTYQTVVNNTGNQDLCYYNFACAHPLWIFSSFNNIFSNIGYLLLGLLFLLIVAIRDCCYKKHVKNCEDNHKDFGIPQHFGLFYAMGVAMCMEGIMSACYHVCPTVTNFQFGKK